MLKEKHLHHLHQARTSHVRMLNSLKLLVSGLNVDENQFKINLIDSAFGKWFYEEAMLFSNGNSRMYLDEMENLLLAFNDHFTKIYQIYFDNKASGLTGLFGMKKKASDAEKELAKRLYDEMVILSDQLKQKLRIFESQLSSMGEEKFAELAYTAPEEPEPLQTAEGGDDGTRYQFGARGH
jgi:hypothetical protein